MKKIAFLILFLTSFASFGQGVFLEDVKDSPAKKSLNKPNSKELRKSANGTLYLQEPGQSDVQASTIPADVRLIVKDSLLTVKATLLTKVALQGIATYELLIALSTPVLTTFYVVNSDSQNGGFPGLYLITSTGIRMRFAAIKEN